MIFVNRVDGSQVLADGQRVQYRGILFGGETLSGYLKTLSGDPDAFLWAPRHAFWPDRYTMATLQPGQAEEFANTFPAEPGHYLLEVKAVGASEYELGGSRIPTAATNRAALAKALPSHPLTVSDPLSAKQLGL